MQPLYEEPLLTPHRAAGDFQTAQVPRSHFIEAMSSVIGIIQDHEVVKIEDSPEPASHTPIPTNSNAMAQPTDPKDPEGYQRRCSGHNKKKGIRCSAIIGRNSHHSRNHHSTFLPTCHAHRDQQSYAGWCQYVQRDGERCGRLFRWTRPYFELCAEHQGHPDQPCYFMGLPLELRLEIFRYLLPSRAIGSSTSLLHVDEDADENQPWYHSTTPQGARPPTALEAWDRSWQYCVKQAQFNEKPTTAVYERANIRSAFPIPLLNLLLVNRQVHDEIRDMMYSSVPFTVDIRKDGTFMCGRRLLEPRRADGSSHYVVGDVDRIKERFLRTFDWAAVRNYNVDILVENWKDDTNRGYHTFPWDEEVEIYDIRDYIGVVVSGILSKARNLCKLNVRLGFSRFTWTETELKTNVETLLGPFERLRNVRQPRLVGVYEGTPQTNFMISLPLPSQMLFNPLVAGDPKPGTPLCSIPQLPTEVPLRGSLFAEYRINWERTISSASATHLVSKRPIRAMFTELKEFYTRLAATVPDVTARQGRFSFLHRARVAREQENVEAFRHLRNELVSYWEAYLEQETRKRDDMTRRLNRMLDADVYPTSWDEEHACTMLGSGTQLPTIASGKPWQNATTHRQQQFTTSSRTGSPHQNCPNSPASSSRPVSGSAFQVPALVDGSSYLRSCFELWKASRQRHEQPKMQLQIGRAVQERPIPNTRGNRASLRSPTVSEEQASPIRSLATLQQSKDQQPMALNPQLHLEAAMSHRRFVEACVSQEVHLLAHRKQVEQFRNQDVYSFMIPSTNEESNAEGPMVAGQQQGESASYPSEPNITIPNAEPALDNYLSPENKQRLAFANAYPPQTPETFTNVFPESSARKRSACQTEQTEDTEMPDGKRQRVDSGLGWSEEEGYEHHEKGNEYGHQAMHLDKQNMDMTPEFKEWRDGAVGNSSWNVAGETPEYTGKGKGKERVQEYP